MLFAWIGSGTSNALDEGGLQALADILPCGQKRVTLVGPSSRAFEVPEPIQANNIKVNQLPSSLFGLDEFSEVVSDVFLMGF
jgi:hypothetical protein